MGVENPDPKVVIPRPDDNPKNGFLDAFGPHRDHDVVEVEVPHEPSKEEIVDRLA